MSDNVELCGGRGLHLDLTEFELELAQPVEEDGGVREVVGGLSRLPVLTDLKSHLDVTRQLEHQHDTNVTPT